MRLITSFLILPAILMTSSLTLAHEGAEGVIQERMDLMSNFSKSVKTLSAMMKGNTAYDANIVRNEAGKIAASSGKHITGLFPENSLSVESEATLAIWKDWPAFERYAMDLEITAKGLVQAADNTGSSEAGGVNSLLGLTAAPGTPAAATMPLTVEALASMPAQEVFGKMTQNCSGCHKKFRMEKD
ncbi:c-type cytochrome [Reinekea marinisedimentorum]|uniref:Cytochrome c556 n=1 Tax=Reinekea marinisedimentorum TaxID=230495 RepID=A0A4R3HU72_9GAMM|nr:cytochrome c [Reinekea marinisedimentorum]TCS36766.1 cytochrome c556 [Reinekea marinisedimentorum]